MKTGKTKSLSPFLFFILCSILAYAQDDAALNVDATDQGMLVPRIALTGSNDTITIASATTSLLIFNTATQNDILPGFYYWNGTRWERIGERKGHYVGELWGGGIVFHVYDNGQHGLIASLDDLHDGDGGVSWGLNGTDIQNCESMTNGALNSAAIIAAGALASHAAGVCDTFSAGGYTDWYLPSNRELQLLASQDILIDQILDGDGDPSTNGFRQEHNASASFGHYWSSTEYGSNTAWYYIFSRGYANIEGKGNVKRVRAVRAF